MFFAFLSKKIPSNAPVKSLSWSSHGFLSYGGDGGTLKVLKLEEQVTKDVVSRGLAAPSNLVVNKTLSGHSGSVVACTWNDMLRKLTTGDENGLITVWRFQKGEWYEDMINSRPKSSVKDMKWDSNGQRICFAYEDGMVVVGSFDSTRLWAKELRIPLTLIQWAPDNNLLIFATRTGEAFKYDSQGNSIGMVPLSSDSRDPSPIVGIDWYDGTFGYIDQKCPALAIAFENGRVQLMVNENDPNPIIIRAGLTCSTVKWNNNGSIIAIAGVVKGETQCSVHFYTAYGSHLRVLKVPGSQISAMAWEKGGLRLALAVESFVYFTNIRPHYTWTFFDKTLVYSFPDTDGINQAVLFWNTKTNEKNKRHFSQVQSLHSWGDKCVIVSKLDDNPNQWHLHLCNSIGGMIDSHVVNVAPLHVAITATHVICANTAFFYVWQFQAGEGSFRILSPEQRESHELMRFIDDAEDCKLNANPTRTSPDPITAICARGNVVCIARQSGSIFEYLLPRMVPFVRCTVMAHPRKISLNCNATTLAVIDDNATLLFCSLESVGDRTPSHSSSPAKDPSGKPAKTLWKTGGKQIDVDRKDIWDIVWAEDIPELSAVMEKTRMYIFRNTDPEDSLPSSGYICDFSKLKVHVAMLDDIMVQPEKPEKSSIFNYETITLRETYGIINNPEMPLDDAVKFITKHPHPKLWRLLTEAALLRLDFQHAEKGFVQCQDYAGIMFVKRLRLLDDARMQQAEVAAYFKKFSEAQSMYTNLNRKDLAVNLGMMLGDWFRVVKLLQTGNVAGDSELHTRALNEIGDFHASEQKWSLAIPQYTQTRNWPALAKCLFAMEEYADIHKTVIPNLQEGHPFLLTIGEWLEGVGISESAVAAYVRGGDIKKAMMCCINLNDWDSGVKLAEKHRLPQMEPLVAQYTNHLLSQNKVIQAIELLRKAGSHSQAAKLLFKLAGDTKDFLRAKNLSILGALEVEAHRKKVIDQPHPADDTQTGEGAEFSKATLDGLINDAKALNQDKTLQIGWRYAEAYHFFLLAQAQLYKGNADSAMKTALHLIDYENILNPASIHSLIALTAYYGKHFKQCSRALTRLETMETLTPEQRSNYQNLAFSIFTKHPPQDPEHKRKFKCPSPSCGAPIAEWASTCTTCHTHISVCVASGKPILDNRYVTCRVCKHPTSESEMPKRKSCALCHHLM
ncbi:WD repeat domain 35 [Pelomyxa schiedti]|nr:WD repeat domain 35 [Pelomyxa schiedti]